MRFFRVFIATCALLLIAAPDAEAQEPGLHGCLGAPVAACLAAMRPFLNPLEYQSAMNRLAGFPTPDVNGRTAAQGKIAVVYHSRFSPPGAPGRVVMISFGPSLRAEHLQISLSPAAQTAATEQDFDRAHIFDAALFALGPRPICAEMATPFDFDRFFYQKLRPRLKPQPLAATPRERKLLSQSAYDTGWIAFCGRKIRYFVLNASWGWLGADMTSTHKSYMAALAFR